MQASNKKLTSAMPDDAISTESEGSELLDETEAVLRRYLVLPSSEAYVALTLWIAATHGVPAWEHATRCAVVSPEKQCGKTRVMEVAEALCYLPLKTANATPAALFRSVSSDPPTILHDEADVVFKQGGTSPANDDLRGFYNAGFQRGEHALRVLPNGDVGEFRTFAMVMLCSIGDLPETIMDRALVIRMRRRAKTEHVESFRTKSAIPLQKLRDQLHDWIRDEIGVLDEAEPETPLQNRPADVWDSLLAVADLASGEWPARARDAAKALLAAEKAAGVESPSVRLLRDIREVWPATMAKMHSSDLCTRLIAGDGFGWDRMNGGHGISANDIATILQPYGIQPAQQKIDKLNKRGYRREWLVEAWDRYLGSGSGSGGVAG